MKTRTLLIGLILITANLLTAQQEEEHVWKKVDASDGTQFWYDSAKLDTMKADKFNIWILETHRPPLTYENIEGEIFRSKTLFAVNLTSVKYGILKIRYFDMNNRELYRFDYDNPPPPESIRYTYPITENSLLHHLITELYGPDGVKTGGESFQ
ncbi:MAG: hypothetical protein KJN64_01885 [Ignavibacteria bacterium]|nr:hypothetical protein [Ignavibacteria bacterium]